MQSIILNIKSMPMNMQLAITLHRTSKHGSTHSPYGKQNQSKWRGEHCNQQPWLVISKASISHDGKSFNAPLMAAHYSSHHIMKTSYAIKSNKRIEQKKHTITSSQVKQTLPCLWNLLMPAPIMRKTWGLANIEPSQGISLGDLLWSFDD